MDAASPSVTNTVVFSAPLGCPKCGSVDVWLLGEDVLVEKLGCVHCGHWWLATRPLRPAARPTPQP